MRQLHDFHFEREFLKAVLQEDFETIGWDFYEPLPVTAEDIDRLSEEAMDAAIELSSRTTREARTRR